MFACLFTLKIENRADTIRGVFKTMHRTRVCIKPMILILVIICLPSIAHADAYTNALYNEAVDLSVDPETDVNMSVAIQKSVVGHGFKQEGFQSMLDERYHGTYVFYKRLSDKNRLVAYETYRETADIESLRLLIMDLLVN